MVLKRWPTCSVVLVSMGLAACGLSESMPTSNAIGGSGGSSAASAPPANKLDLLLMIDNSRSMADKQELLSLALPRLLARLLEPQPDPATGELAIRPLTDVHIGVITSSLGGHGGQECAISNPSFTAEEDDGAHLLPSVRDGVPSQGGLGFLSWDPAHGNGDLGELIVDFTANVQSAGEAGCGFEAQLESWYRFLVDPSPPEVVAVDPQTQVASVGGLDHVLLEQRADFLRPDSAVAIILLTDENDCSLVDEGYGWLATKTTNPNKTPFQMPRGTSICKSNPDSPCCRSCASVESEPPPGCGDLASDPECQKGPHDVFSDDANLRCWEQKRRFGIDLLYPTRKYAEALTQPRICPRWDATGPVGCTSDTRVPNPLLEDARGHSRPPERVFLVGIVGVPWQDLATEATLNAPDALELSTAAELAEHGRWKWLVPDCRVTAANAEKLTPTGLAASGGSICDRWDFDDQPDDVFMVESDVPRAGFNPPTGTLSQPPGAPFAASPINGHEWETASVELQYACTFALPVPRDCTSVTGECDCAADNIANIGKSPVCQGSEGYGTLQTQAKAFPGVRQLQVLHDIGNQAVVASVCPKNTTDPGSQAYGYFAAMDLLAETLAPVLAAP